MNGTHLLTLMEQIAVLKNTPRSGWTFSGMRNAESIADHCFRVALLAMTLADILAKEIDVDTGRVMRIALLHELAESQIGDIPYPAQKYIPEAVKHQAEEQAITDMFESFGTLGKYYVKLWKEFEQQSSIEGHIVKVADKLELLIQTLEYEKIGNTNLDEFWNTLWNEEGIYDFSITAEIMDILRTEHERIRGTC